jgi:hypothetical protein
VVAGSVPAAALVAGAGWAAVVVVAAEAGLVEAGVELAVVMGCEGLIGFVVLVLVLRGTLGMVGFVGAAGSPTTALY